MSLKKVCLVVLGLVASSTLAAESNINLTKEYGDKKFSIKSTKHSVSESLFQGRSKYGISGTVVFAVNRGRGKEDKFTCKYGRVEMMVDGPAVDMPQCKLNKKVKFSGTEYEQLLVTSQLISVDQRKPGEKDPYCKKHILNSTFKIVPDDLSKQTTNFGHSEVTIHSTCLDNPEYS